MSRLRLRRTEDTEEWFSLEALAQQIEAFQFNGLGYAAFSSPMATSWGESKAEPIGNDFRGYVEAAYKADGIVFATIQARLALSSDIRFQWQRTIPKPGDLFGNTELAILEKPWPNGTTGDLMARVEQSVSLAGNFYAWRNRQNRTLRYLRPDWVSIVVGSPSGGDEHALDAEVVAYLYKPGGPASSSDVVTLWPEDVIHYAPIPDPTALFRGMSWVTSVLPEIQADKQATAHKLKFFEKGAVPPIIFKYDPSKTSEQIVEYAKAFSQQHGGVANAYKALHIGGGADPVVVGKDFQQLDFKVTQGAGETRIAAASEIPAIVAGLSEGMEASTYSNFGQARRLVADKFLRPRWRGVCGAFESVLSVPGDARLWYDPSDCSFLQEDEADAAAILKEQMLTIESAVRSGYTPDSAKLAVAAGDVSLLEHTGLFSVQLQPPMPDGPAAPSPA